MKTNFLLSFERENRLSIYVAGGNIQCRVCFALISIVFSVNYIRDSGCDL
jgi:hypothetical protein